MSDEALILRLESLLAQDAALEAQHSEPDVASDHQRATDVARKRAAIGPVVGLFRQYKAAARAFMFVAIEDS